MRQVSVTELKNRLSEYLRLVKNGETLEILERSVPIARLERVEAGDDGGDAQLERLLRDGIVSRPRRRPKSGKLETPPVPCRGDAVRALIEERGRD